MGSIVIALVSPSICGPWSIRSSLNISETAHYFFLKICMELGVNKVKKVTRLEFGKNLNPGIKATGGDPGSKKHVDLI